MESDTHAGWTQPRHRFPGSTPTAGRRVAIDASSHRSVPETTKAGPSRAFVNAPCGRQTFASGYGNRMLELLLARHGETAWNVEGRVQGHTDLPLNETGSRRRRRWRRSWRPSLWSPSTRATSSEPGRPRRRWRAGTGSRSFSTPTSARSIRQLGGNDGYRDSRSPSRRVRGTGATASRRMRSRAAPLQRSSASVAVP